MSQDHDRVLAALPASLRESVPGLPGVWAFGTWGTEHERPFAAFLGRIQ